MMIVFYEKFVVCCTDKIISVLFKKNIKRKELKYQENVECLCRVVLNTHLQCELYNLHHSTKLYIKLIEY